jgi:Na+/H+ antiporter NhaC
METLNAWLGREEYNFWLWLVLFILTCSIFELYYEYKMAKGINEIQENNGLHENKDLALICVLISIFSLGLAATAIQQWEVNKFYGESADD